MANIRYRQEMPRPGGYSEPTWQKVTRRNFSGYRWFLAGTAVMGGSLWLYNYFDRNERMERLRVNDMALALEPFLKAEKDRGVLKQLIKNHEEEAELMKDIPDWTVGTYYGKPIYHNPGKHWVHPSPAEFYAHRDIFGQIENPKNRIPIYDEEGNAKIWLSKPEKEPRKLLEMSGHFVESHDVDMPNIKLYPPTARY